MNNLNEFTFTEPIINEEDENFLVFNENFLIFPYFKKLHVYRIKRDKLEDLYNFCRKYVNKSKPVEELQDDEIKDFLKKYNKEAKEENEEIKKIDKRLNTYRQQNTVIINNPNSIRNIKVIINREKATEYIKVFRKHMQEFPEENMVKFDRFNVTTKEIQSFAKHVLSKMIEESIVRIGVCNKEFLLNTYQQFNLLLDDRDNHKNKNRTIHSKNILNPTEEQIVEYLKDIINKENEFIQHYGEKDIFVPNCMFFNFIPFEPFEGIPILTPENNPFIEFDNYATMNCCVWAILYSYIFKTKKMKNIDEYLTSVKKMYKTLNLRVNSCFGMGSLAEKMGITLNCYKGSNIKVFAYSLNPGTLIELNLLLKDNRHCVSLLDKEKYYELIENSNKLNIKQRSRVLSKHCVFFNFWGKNIDVPSMLLIPDEIKKSYISLESFQMIPMSVKKWFPDIYALDIETISHEGELKPYCLVLLRICDSGFYEENSEKEPVVYYGLDCVRCFLNDMEKEQALIYAHNGGRFDTIFILSEIIEHYYKEVDDIWLTDKKYPETMYKNNTILSLNFNRLEFRDSYRLMKEPLSKLAKFNGCKEKGDMDHSKINIDNFMDIKDEIISYCINDCEILKTSILNYSKIIPKELCKNYKSAEFFFTALTCTHLSKMVYLDNYASYLNTLPTSIDRQIRPWYQGGRTSAFKQGVFKKENGKIWYLDVNSLYPFIASNYAFLPTSVPKVICNCSLENIKNNLIDYCTSFVECSISCENMNTLPFLGIKENNVLVFYKWKGIKSMFLYIPCFIQAIECGYTVHEIKQVIYFKPGKPFKDYYELLFHYRQKTDNVIEKNIIKILMNSLTGALGMKYEDIKAYEYHHEPLSLVSDLLESEYVKTINGDMVKVSSYINGDKTNVAIISAITSLARLYMYKKIYKPIIEDKNCQILYTDTDSVIYQGKEINLPLGSKLGELKVEYDDIIEITIVNVKCYAMKYKIGDEIKEKIVAKGYETKTLNYDNFVEHLNTDRIFSEKVPFRLTIDTPNLKISEKRNFKKNFKMEMSKPQEAY